MKIAAEAVVEIAIHDKPRNFLDQDSLHPVAQPGYPPLFLNALGKGDATCLRETYCGRKVRGSGMDNDASSKCPVGVIGDQRADAFRTVDLVGIENEVIDSPFRGRNSFSSCGLGGIDQDLGARGMGGPDDRLDRIHGADLVVGSHHDRQVDSSNEGVIHIRQIDTSAFVHTDPTHLGLPLIDQGSEVLEDCVVLYPRRCDPELLSAISFDSDTEREADRFACPRGEAHVLRFGANERRHVFRRP